MSSDETRLALSRAFELVESGNYTEARAILDPLLAREPNNADVWWIYAHAATDPNEGRTALERVLTIDPNYPGAAELIAIARERYPETSTGMASVGVETSPDVPPSLPEVDFPVIDDEDEEFASAYSEGLPAETDPRSGRRFSLLLPLLGLVIVLVLVVVLLVLLQGGGTTPETPTPTEVAAGANTPIPAGMTTDEVSATATVPEGELTQAATRPPTITPTFTLAPGETAEAVAQTQTSDETLVRGTLVGFVFEGNGVETATTSLGNSLLISLCSAPGREMRTLLPQAMNSVARQSASLSADVEAIAVRLVNCETDEDLRTVAVDRASAEAYADGNLNDGEFAALWQPQ